MPTLQKIEVTQKNIKLKCAAAILFFVVGAATLAFVLNASLSKETGWQEIKSDASYVDSYADAFVLMYDLGAGGTSPTEEHKALKALYTDALQEAYRLFHSTQGFEGVENLSKVNAHPNEAVSVAPALYQALEQIAASGNRQLFLAPVATQYKQIFLSESDEEASLYDPRLNQELRSWVEEMVSYAGNPAHISLEVLGDNCVKLQVSGAYLKFAEENEITAFVDFGWMVNAFVADWIAETLADAGFTGGYLTSIDGFTRNLDGTGRAYSMNLLDRQPEGIYQPARMHYQAPVSIVSLRDYPMTNLDRWRYYRYENGDTVTVFLDPKDGMSKSAVANLTAYSKDIGCGEILLKVADSFVADTWEEDTVMALTAEGIFTIWPEGKTLVYNDPEMNLELLPDSAPGYSKILK